MKGQMSTRINMIDEAARIAVAQLAERASLALLFFAQIQVTAVLDTSPPTIPPIRIPFFAPRNFIRIYPIRPRPEVRMMTQPISLGLRTSQGPKYLSGRNGKIKRAMTTNRMKSYISSAVIFPTIVLIRNFEESTNTIKTVIIRLISIIPISVVEPRTKARRELNSVVEP